MNVPTLRPLSFGEILDGAFTLYRRNLVTFVLTTLILAIAIIAVTVVLGGAVASGISDIEDLGALFGALFGMLLVMGIAFGVVISVLSAALTREASQAYTGQPTSVLDGLRAGLRNAGRVFLSGAAAFVMMLVASFGMAMVLGMLQAMGLAVGLVLAINLLLSLVLYLLAMAGLFAVLPAIVVEGKGPVEAISRSFDLVRGAPWQVAGIMMVTGFITFLPLLAVLLMTGGLRALMDRDAIPSMTQFITQQVLTLGVGILTTPFLFAVIVLLYYDRRVRTEALDVQMLADRLAVL